MPLRKFLLLSLLCVAPNVQAVQLLGIPQFIDEMVEKHQFQRDTLEQAFEHAQYRATVINAISQSAISKPWVEYRDAFVNIKRIKGGLQFWARYANELHQTEQDFGVAQEIIVALIGIETQYGHNSGKFTTLDTLATLAFDYRRRGSYFRSELEQYLLLAREQKFDLSRVQGSYAGALGIPQFMPSSYRKYALDYDLDGKTDLLGDPVDAIGSVANYLKQYGWEEGGLVAARATVNDAASLGTAPALRTLGQWSEVRVNADHPIISATPARLIGFSVTEGKEFWFAFANFDVITRYNNSDYYAMAVFQLATALRAAHEQEDTPH